MERRALDKLAAALAEAGYEITRFEEEPDGDSPWKKTRNILLKASPVFVNPDKD